MLILLQLLPNIVSCHVHDEKCSAGTFFICLVPLLVAWPAFALPNFVKNEVHEHILRHALFTLGFAMGGVQFDWSYLLKFIEEQWSYTLLVFYILTTVALGAYTVFHFAEEYCRASIRTHYGDVLILPLVMISVAKFYDEIPNQAFILSRSMPLAVVIMVAWTTILLIAFADFANKSTSRALSQHFHTLSTAALAFTTVHMILIELQAHAIYYVAFTLAASLFAQLMVPLDEVRDSISKDRFARIIVAMCIAASMCTLWIVGDKVVHHWGMQRSQEFGWGGFGWGIACLGTSMVFGQEIGLVVLGKRWWLSTSLMCMIPSLALAERRYTRLWGYSAIGFSIFQWIGFAAVSFVTSTLQLDIVKLPEIPVLPQAYDPPQLRRLRLLRRSSKLYVYMWGLLDRPLPRFLFPSSYFSRTGDWLSAMLAYSDGETRYSNIGDSGYIGGVWWMKDNTMPMHVLVLHDSGKESGSVNFHHDISRAATWIGACFHWLAVFQRSELIRRGSGWMQTNRYTDIFGFTASGRTLWIYKDPLSQHEMTRLQYDRYGNVVYQYQLLRIAYIDSVGSVCKTRYYGMFMDSCDTVPFLFSSSR